MGTHFDTNLSLQLFLRLRSNNKNAVTKTIDFWLLNIHNSGCCYIIQFVYKLHFIKTITGHHHIVN